jgi:hypothetical protein
MNGDRIQITDTRAGVEVTAVCRHCRATWQRPDDDPYAHTLVTWARNHDCRDGLPGWLADLDGPEAAAFASTLHGVALDVQRHTIAAGNAQNAAMTARDEGTYWHAAGRRDGLSEAHAYLVRLVEGLTRRGGDLR